MEKTENKPIVIGADAAPFKFELSQLVEMRISDEWGEVKARAQYAYGENQYPNTALVGVQVDSEQFGSQQVSRNYHLRGRILQVPSNYNPQTRQ